MLRWDRKNQPTLALKCITTLFLPVHPTNTHTHIKTHIGNLYLISKASQTLCFSLIRLAYLPRLHDVVYKVFTGFHIYPYTIPVYLLYTCIVTIITVVSTFTQSSFAIFRHVWCILFIFIILFYSSGVPISSRKIMCVVYIHTIVLVYDYYEGRVGVLLLLFYV